MKKNDNIVIRNARVHNLKGIDVSIPRGKMVVITGLSGSGKTSLAFDTLYAEGQRRYVESLSSYVRQFLGRNNKPEVDFIDGIPPAIAIEQKVINNNPRSTVGTTTEIYEYIKLMYARIGRTFSPVSGVEVRHHTVEDVINHIVSLAEGTVALLLVPVMQVMPLKKDDFISQLRLFLSQGFNRMMIGGEIVRIADAIDASRSVDATGEVFLIVDRVTASAAKELRNRLYDSVETAFFEGHDRCVVSHQTDEGWVKTHFSKAFEADGITFQDPTERMFAFNSPAGACPRCEGFGKILGIDPDLVIPDHSLSVYDDAIIPWRGTVGGVDKQDFILNAERFRFPIHKPFYALSDEQRQLLWTGNKYFRGLNDFFKEVESQQYKIQYRVMLARYRGKTVCPVCHGSRLRQEASYVKVGGKSISELIEMPIGRLSEFFKDLELTDHERITSRRILKEITSRLEYLMDVGLEYLTLNRQSNTLSGGESQRINLATQLGSALVGSLYILDEPSIGLHPRDTQRLIRVLHRLRDLGNTVVIVEHDEEIMRAADYIVDIGPEAGRRGGQVVFASEVDRLDAIKNVSSYTLDYLTRRRQIEMPLSRRRTANYIQIKGITQNNLKNVTAKFPLGIMTAVTGVSGSGKSSLVRDVLYNALRSHFGQTVDEKVHYGSLSGSLHLIKNVEVVDQNPIGKSSRSNPVTYLKAYDEIRKLFAAQQLSTQMGYTPAHFSFNVDGGRCPVCQGEGTVTVPMQFMADMVLPCEECHGMRFKQDILQVRFHEKNIYDVLEMTVNQAIEFFEAYPDATTKRIVRRLRPLQEVGIGYIKLGQSSSTLSGGESQRVKLAYHLSAEGQDHIFFIFDEPTTGLHSHDINTLMKAFNALIAKGNTVLVVEHNMDVVKCADWVIDLGPEGGDRGGNIVVEGTPEMVAACAESYTGQALGKLIIDNR